MKSSPKFNIDLLSIQLTLSDQSIKLKDKTAKLYGIFSEFFLRWRAICMKEILGYEVDEVAAVFRMSPRIIERYVSRVLNFGEVKPNTIGRPINSVAVHPHVEFLIMEAVLAP